MRRTGRALQFALIAGGLAACGSSSTGLPAGFECLGQALPTTAPALVNVTGMVTSDVLSPKPVAHAFVYGFRTGGATVTSMPTGTVRYNAGGAPSSSATATAADGVAYIANVAPGNVTVQATASGQTLRQHTVNARANAITLTEIQP